MAELTAEQRRRNVELVRGAGERLEMIEKKLLAALSEIGPMAREVRAIREDIETALSGAPKEEQDDG